MNDDHVARDGVFARCFEQFFVVGMDDDDDRTCARPCRESVKRMGDNGSAADGSILLRAFGGLAGALAASGSYNHHAALKLFLRLHLLYEVPHSPIFAVMYREGACFASTA
jgi:hypothetical protein